MIKRIALFALIWALFFMANSSIFTPAFAKPLDSNTLINNTAKYDGKIIEFEGEAIGEIMKRGNFAWVNVNDGQNAIGIYMPYSEAKKIKYLGRYLVKGDTIYVKGIFHRACSAHGGDIDIHAYELKIIKSGYRFSEKVDSKRAVTGILLFLSGCLLMGIAFKNKW